MYTGLFERARRGGGGGEHGEDGAGLYSDAALRAEEAARRAERHRQLTPANLAKLPTERWAEVVGGIEPDHMERMLEQNAELASQLPDTMWQRHAAAYSPENIELARKAPEP